MSTGEIKYSYIGENRPRICSIYQSSAYGNIDASYNWVNVEYPTPHTHKHWELFVIISGTIEQIINKEARLLHAGDACLVKPDDCHLFLYPENDKIQNYQHFNIVVSEEYTNAVLRGYLKSNDLELTNENRYFKVDEYIINTILDKSVIAQSYERDEYELTAKFLFNILLAKYFEQRLFTVPTPPWLSQMLIDLNNPAYFGSSVKDFASKAGYSYSRLNQLFKMHIKKSISEYHIEVKMEYAKKKLMFTDSSVLSIAVELGYDSISAFNSKFKEICGASPLKFKKSNKETH